MPKVSRSIRQTLSRLLPRKEYTTVGGSIIPSPDRRWCGPQFKDDNFYLKSAESDANRLVTQLGCTTTSRVLDVGCGQGRLAIGLMRVIGDVQYQGIDIDKKSIDWCERYLSNGHPTYTFTHLNIYNERYNPAGVQIGKDFRFNISSRSVDIINLFSVFSHTTEHDMRRYLHEFSRILNTGGKIFFSTYVDEDVPDFSVNPPNYHLPCSGPLHIVRYDKAYLFSILSEYGFSLIDFTHETEADGQSAIYLENTR